MTKIATFLEKKLQNYLKKCKLEEINGANACPTYLYRWILWKIGPYRVYLHKFVGEDWSHDFHDHPKRFISIGLKGSYVEITPDEFFDPFSVSYNADSLHIRKTFRAPWFRSFPATHKHRIKADPEHPCWTLVITGRPTREWGFWHLAADDDRQPYRHPYQSNKFILWKDYVNDEDIVNEVKTCP